MRRKNLFFGGLRARGSPVSFESGPGAKDSLDYPLLPLSIFGEKWEARAGRLPVLRTYVPLQKGITHQVRAFGEV